MQIRVAWQDRRITQNNEQTDQDLSVIEKPGVQIGRGVS